MRHVGLNSDLLDSRHWSSLLTASLILISERNIHEGPILHTRSTANHVNTLSHLTLILTLKGGLIVLILEMRKWAQKAKLLVGSHYINKRVAGQGFKSRSVTK